MKNNKTPDLKLVKEKNVENLEKILVFFFLGQVKVDAVMLPEDQGLF